MKVATTIKLSLTMLAAAFLLFSASKFVQADEFRRQHAEQEQIKTVVSRQLDCLAKNIYFEAGNEPFEGKLAVAQVTINRSNHSRFPSDVCDVVYEKTRNAETGKIVCQFSWFCEPRKKITDKFMWEESMLVAKLALVGEMRHEKLENALFYHANYVNPGWKGVRKITQIGRHIFYEKPSLGRS